MPINADKPHLWKADVAQSIDFYNGWFLRFAPDVYRKQCVIRATKVLAAFDKTGNLGTRQNATLKRWLVQQGYRKIPSNECSSLDAMPAGAFTFHHTLPPAKKKTSVNIPIDRAPLSECCTFISYDKLELLAKEKHLGHLSDSVLDEYGEEAE